MLRRGDYRSLVLSVFWSSKATPPFVSPPFAVRRARTTPDTPNVYAPRSMLKCRTWNYLCLSNRLSITSLSANSMYTRMIMIVNGFFRLLICKLSMQIFIFPYCSH
ncbi:hypothetical protein KP509_16G040100 [Ceratopteris richardii]|uniref:Uncharacterized protein n=1 Tax=Ceratopteris richardii TaxID=49495 RepID=A0A8T2T2C3_CERRI|nr:hypothetical protein KP509_16G040100 [Ceratopteris richardii]